MLRRFTQSASLVTVLHNSWNSESNRSLRVDAWRSSFLIGLMSDFLSMRCIHLVIIFPRRHVRFSTLSSRRCPEAAKEMSIRPRPDCSPKELHFVHMGWRRLEDEPGVPCRIELLPGNRHPEFAGHIEAGSRWRIRSVSTRERSWMEYR